LLSQFIPNVSHVGRVPLPNDLRFCREAR
jgi:hypothetical protein